MDDIFRDQIEELLGIGESLSNIRALAEVIGIDENNPVLIEVLQEIREKPYVIICEDTSGRYLFLANRTPTLDLAIEEARELTHISQSFDEIAGIEPNIYRYRVYGPSSNKGIDIG